MSGDRLDDMLATQAQAPTSGGEDTLAAQSGTHRPAQGPRPGEAIEQGASFGRYVVLSRLGAGGMGVVYAAYDPELDRKVALKLLHPQAGAASSLGRTRLLREAQAMARLSHPNVVAIHDVGTLDERVWLAMEYVDGRTFGTWLKEQPRRWPEVLGVMLAAGRGLVAAHAAGLVHRDLKPDNIMIDREGRVRVMDFGLARSADEQPAAAPQDPRITATSRGSLNLKVTQHGAVTGTPMYMAPEQWRSEEADARADQFAFCVTLWEGLHGQRPFDGQSIPQLAAAVLSGELRTPPRSRVPAWLHRTLVRGLALDPAQRFPAMEALLHALERGLTRGRRRRTALGLAALGLVAALVPGYRAYDHARREAACDVASARISEVWNDASRAALAAAITRTDASYAATTLEKMTPWIDRWTRRWSEVRADVCREGQVERTRSEALHERAVTCLDERREELAALLAVIGEDPLTSLPRAVIAAASLAPPDTCTDWNALERRPAPPGDPEARAQLAAHHRELARILAFNAAGRFADALTQAETLVTQARESGLATIAAQAELIVGTAAKRAGDFERSAAALQAAYVDAGAIGDDETALAAATELITVLGYDLSKPDAGLQWAHASEMLLRRLGHLGELPGVAYYNALAIVHRQQDHFDEAQALYERAIELLEKNLGPDHPALAGPLNNLANLLEIRGDSDHVVPLFTRAIEVLERALGPDHPNVALLIGNFASARYRHGELDAALVLNQRALAIQEQALGPDHTEVASTLGNRALIFYDRREYAGARPLLERAIAIRERRLSPEHPRIADLLTILADVAHSEGALDEAIALDERALAIYEATWGPEHSDVAYPLLGLGMIYTMRGDPGRARPLLERALAIREKVLTPDSPETLLASIELAVALADLGEDAAARELLQRLLPLAEDPSRRTMTASSAHSILAFLDLRAGDLDASEAKYQRALDLCRENRGGESPACAIHLAGLGQVALARGRPADALPPLERALALGARDRVLPSEYGEIRFALARALRAAGREPERARALAQEAAEIYRKLGPLRREPAEIAAWLKRPDR